MGGSIKEQGSHEELMKIPIEKGPDGEMLRGWYHDLWQTQHGKEDNSERLEEMAKENEMLKKNVAELQADVLKQKQTEKETIRILKEEINRLKLQSINQILPQPELVRAKTLPCKSNEADQNGLHFGVPKSEL